ncbi:MAG: flippase [Brumimicrobium sp.]|nr:flippase [Brumimicrobium sp.]
MASFFKDFLSIGFSKILIISFGLGSSIIIARYIGPSGNGTIAALTVYPSLFLSFGSLGISQATTFYTGKKIFSEEQIKTAITQIWMITVIISLVTCYLLMRYFSNSGDNLLLVSLALLPIPFTLFNKYNSGLFLGRNDIKTYNRINWIPTLIVLLGAVIFVILLHWDIAGAMLATILGGLFMSIVLLFKNKFLKSFSLKFEWRVIQSMLSLGMIYALSLLVIGLNYRVDVIMIDKLSTAFELGIYSKGAGFAEYLWEIPMLFSSIVFARSAVSKKQKEFSYKVIRLLRVSFIGVGLGALVLLFLSEYIIPLMYGKEFYGSVSVLNYLLPGILALTIFKVINMDLAGRGKPWIAMWAMLPALGVNIILNYFFIPKYGANGAAYSSTISYGVAGVLFLYFYSKETKIPIKEILKFRREDFAPIKGIIKKIIKR